jgi:lipooligosaccharide transport system ATP-binding protein
VSFLVREFTARAQLITMARFHGLTGEVGRARVEELLEFVKLSDRADARLYTFSGGMKRRTMIARGLIGSPEILVLDEPTTGLDPQARQDLWARLTALKRKGATLLLTTHYMDEAERLCDRLVIIDDGKIVAQGTPRELIATHVSSHVVELTLAGDGVVPDPVKPLTESVPASGGRVEVLPERLLFYVNKGDDVLAEIARLMPDARTLVRPATLEDVFLHITGRSLEE